MSNDRQSDTTKESGKSKKKEMHRDREERLLEAFVDGETTAEERLYVQRQIESGNEDLKRGLQSLKIVRKELCDWIDGQVRSGQGAHHRVDLWSKVEQRIADGEGAPATIWEQLLEWCRGVFDSSRETWDRPQVFAPAFVVVLVAFFAGYLWGGRTNFGADTNQQFANLEHYGDDKPTVAVMRGQGVREPAQMIAMVDEPDIRVDDVKRFPLPLPRERSVRLAVAGSDLLTSNKPTFARNIPLIHRTLSVIRREPVPGGLRAGSSDIDWIDTTRRFRIVASGDPGAPPVIWLTKDTARAVNSEDGE